MMGIARLSLAQETLTLQDCYALAEMNYPLYSQEAVIEETATTTIGNVLKANLPQLTIGGQATYQSEVTRVPVEMPGVEPLSKDQYKVFAELSQTVFHGGVTGQLKKAEESRAGVERRELEVELYQVKSKINDLFFGVLLAVEQVRQAILLRNDISAALGRAEASIRNGILIPSAADVLRAELLQVQQRIIELQSAEENYRNTLSSFINRPVSSETVLQKPVFGSPTEEVRRPELALFDAQEVHANINESLMVAGLKPRLDLFAQGGYGRPGLNVLENEFDTYYLGGIRFRWQLSGYYTLKSERQIFRLRKNALDIRRQTFIFNNRQAAQQQNSEVARLRNTIVLDDEIILLRTRIKQAASVQLDQGVITASDFVREVIAEDQARQHRALHEIQLLHAQAKLQFTNGQ